MGPVDPHTVLFCAPPPQGKWDLTLTLSTSQCLTTSGCTFCSAAAALWRPGALLHSSLLPKFPPRTRAQEALRASSFPINLTPTPGILAWNRERECQVWPLASPSSDPLLSPSDSSHLRAFFYLSNKWIWSGRGFPYITPLYSSSPPTSSLGPDDMAAVTLIYREKEGKHICLLFPKYSAPWVCFPYLFVPSLASSFWVFDRTVV